MKLRRITAALLAAAMLAGMSVPAYAADIKGEVTTETVSVSYLASSAKTWDGKAKMKEGVSYVTAKDITISSAVTIPKKASLTVKKGTTLTIGAKGSLTVNGSLAVQTKGTLAVNGKLTLNSGKTMKCDGSIKFGNSAVAKLDGKFYLFANGKITGEPSKATFGKTSAIVMGGKNSSKKMKTAVNNNYASLLKASSKKKVSKATAKKEIQEHFNKYLELYVVDKAHIHSVSSIYCKSDLDTAFGEAKTDVFTQEAFFYDNTEMLNDQLISAYTLGNIKSSKNVKSVKMTVTDIYDCTSIKEIMDILKPRYGSVTQCWGVYADYTITLKDGKKHTTSGVVLDFAYSNGNIYLAGEDLSKATYK